MDYFANSLAHILAELKPLDLLVRAQVWRARQLHQREGEGVAPFCITEAELDRLLDRAVGSPVWDGVPFAPEMRDQLQSTLDQMNTEIHACVAESLRRGIDLRLVTLARVFGLSAFDMDVVLVALAPELDRRYSRLYAYLQDDVTRKHPTVDLVLNLLCQELDQKIDVRERFASGAPLRRHGLVHLFEDPNLREPSLLSNYLQLDRRIADYLLGSDQLDDPLRAYAHLVERQTRPEDLIYHADFKQRLAQLAKVPGNGGHRAILYFQGPYGTGKQAIAEAFCHGLGIGLLVASTGRLAPAKMDEFESLVRLAAREALLQGAALYWDGIDVLLNDDQEVRRELWLHVLVSHPGLIFMAGDTAWDPSGLEPSREFVRIEVPRPTYAQRAQLWGRVLYDNSVDPEAVARKFRLSAGQIRDAAATAQSLARWRDPADGRLTKGDLYAACRLQSNRKLARLAQKIAPHYGWDDIVLPPEQIEQLHAICYQVNYHDLVFETWGFNQKLASGKGLSALFSGPPGTGKTMAADVMANELGLDLYKIDLSAVVSKYIGETEKNLSRIFTEARTSNAILFFDEADALFGKRSEVRDAHDRYANIEISYLLQKMEEYEGVVILATNLSKNMDEAFVRRLHFVVEFPFPKSEERRRIWAGIWPEATPRSPDLDLDYLADQIEVAGGNIRNIALASAFLAAADGGEVQMKHIVQGTQREYRKMGKVLTTDEFTERSTSPDRLPK